MLFSSCFTQIINLCKIGKQTNLIKQIFLFQILHFIFFFTQSYFFLLQQHEIPFTGLHKILFSFISIIVTLLTSIYDE